LAKLVEEVRWKPKLIFRFASTSTHGQLDLQGRSGTWKFRKSQLTIVQARRLGAAAAAAATTT